MDASPPPSRSTAAALLALGCGAVLLAGQPAVFAQTFSSGAVLRSALLALLATAALYCAWTAPSPRPALGRWRLGLLLLPLGIALLSLPAIGGGLRSAGRHDGLWILLSVLPLGLLGTWSGVPDAKLTLRAVLLSGLVAALLVLLDALSGHPAVGPFGRTGIAGPVLAALAAAAIVCPPLPDRGQRWLKWAPFALLALACLTTQSRAGVIALVLASLAALAAAANTAAARRKLRMALAFVAALGAVLLGLMVEDVLPLPGGRRTVEVRLGLQRASLAAIAERPLRGHGAGSFAAVALRHRDLEEARLEPGRRARHAHLDALHATVEGGVPAGLLFLFFVLGVGITAARAGSRASVGNRSLYAAALGMAAALAIAGLGDGLLIDPAPVLLFSLATALACVRPEGAGAGARTGRVGRLLAQGLPVLGALLALGCCYVFSADALSDRSLMRYRHAIAGHISPQEAQRAARLHLEEGALRWRSDAPEALYRLGVQQAMANHFAQARDTFHGALRADAGMTEARLDLAQVYQLKDRYADARAVLIEARRHDPTRYDVPRRIMELELGPEPVPGDAPTEMDELEVMRWMNRASQLAPGRFENYIDQSRFARRRDTDGSGLVEAGGWVRAALHAAPGPKGDPPAEVLIESFRLSEYENRASPLFHSVVLTNALRKNPRPARRFGAEAARFLDIGQEREAAALKAVGLDPSRMDMRSANRAYDAAAVRMTALLYAEQDNPEAVLALARIDRDAGRFRRALARYRSLLAWTLPPQEGEHGEELHAPARIQAMAREGDLLLEAASVAHRVDQGLANFYRIRGQLRIGYELLLTDHLRNAGRKFRAVLEADPGQADAHFGLARVLARQGDPDEAETHLIAALRLKPILRGPARTERDLTTLLQRANVRLHLGLD